MELPKGILSEKSIDWFNPNRGQVLGEGTYGEVRRYGNKVVKIGKKILYGTDASLLREAAFLCKLNHPNIIKVLDVFALPGMFCLILPEARMDLLMRRKLKPTLSRDEVKIISYQLLRGIAYLHSQDILHGDLKPSNILLFEEMIDDNNGPKPCQRIVIADFGLARPNQCTKVIEQREVFTLWYRAPELLLGGSYTNAADVWAAGCIIHEMFTNTVLFAGCDETIELALQFGKLGVPSEQTWPGVSLLPYYDDIPQPIFNNTSLLTGVRNFDLLIAKMLKLDPRSRSGTTELLTDPWFDSILDKMNSGCLRAPAIISINCGVSTLDNVINLVSINSYILSPKDRANVFRYLFKFQQLLDLDDYFIFFVISLFDRVYSGDFKNKFPLLILASCIFLSSQLLDAYTGKLKKQLFFYFDVSGKIITNQTLTDTNLEIIQLLKMDFYVSSPLLILDIFVTLDIREISIDLLKLISFTSLIYRYKIEDIIYFCICLVCKYLNKACKYENKIINYESYLTVLRKDLVLQELDKEKLDYVGKNADKLIIYIYS